jgi:uncharacterized membrane protein
MTTNEDSLRKITQFDYLLHIAGMIFSFGILTLVAIVLNYLKRGSAAGTIYESHMNYMIRYWWRWVLWMVVLGVIIFVVGILTLTIGFWLLGWTLVIPSIIFIYRMVMGLLAANDGKVAPA